MIWGVFYDSVKKLANSFYGPWTLRSCIIWISPLVSAFSSLINEVYSLCYLSSWSQPLLLTARGNERTGSKKRTEQRDTLHAEHYVHVDGLLFAKVVPMTEGSIRSPPQTRPRLPILKNPPQTLRTCHFFSERRHEVGVGCRNVVKIPVVESGIAGCGAGKSVTVRQNHSGLLAWTD